MKHSVILFVVFFGISFLVVNCVGVARKRIINGLEAEENVPYAAFVSGTNSENVTFGGASFITYTHLLTSGSIIYNMTWLHIRWGSIIDHDTRQSIVEKAIVHPSYDPFSFTNNIGVLFLTSAVDPGEFFYQFNFLTI